jgi:hypothetical protein
MERRGILKQLLTLSRDHYRLVVEERWDQWESVAEKKEELVRCLDKAGPTDPDDAEALLLAEIAGWERQTENELRKRKQETRERLIRVKRARLALKDYGKATRGHSGPHFGIRC